MSELTLATASAAFGRDLDACMATISTLIGDARDAGADMLVLPEACLGGYLGDLTGDDGSLGTPPALRPDGPELAAVAALAGPLVVCLGYAEDGGDGWTYNAAACVSGDGVLGRYRKVHQPLREDLSYAPGDTFAAFDTPVGRIGMQICYDKAFPEAARSLALDGARIIVSVSAWPMSRTDPAPNMEDDRQSRMFDLYDRARAAENQIVWIASNQWGTFGSLRLLGRAKIVNPAGDIVAATGCAEGMAVTSIDVDATVARARRSMHHLRDRRPAAYRNGAWEDAAAAPATAAG